MDPSKLFIRILKAHRKPTNILFSQVTLMHFGSVMRSVPFRSRSRLFTLNIRHLPCRMFPRRCNRRFFSIPVDGNVVNRPRPTRTCTFMQPSLDSTSIRPCLPIRIPTVVLSSLVYAWRKNLFEQTESNLWSSHRCPSKMFSLSIMSSHRRYINSVSLESHLFGCFSVHSRSIYSVFGQ